MRTRMVFLPLDEFFLTPMSTVRRWAAAVADRVPELDVVAVEAGQDPSAAVRDADAVFGTLTPTLLAVAGRLRWLQAPAASPPDGFFFPGLVAHRVVVTNLRGVYRANLADHVMACVLAFARGLPTFLAHQHRREWHRRPEDAGILDLAATTMLLIGVGEVGSAIADRCSVFGVRVVGIDPAPGQVRARLSSLHPPGDLGRLLPDADWVVLTVPDTPATRGLIDLARLRRMRSSAFLLNVGRGATVRLDDLVAALAAGHLAGAALDVFETEPLPADHPLWERPDVIITPHVAGFGADTDAEREALIVDNARRFVAGQPLRNVVDKETRF